MADEVRGDHRGTRGGRGNETWRGGTTTLVILAIVFFGLTLLASVLTQYGGGWIGVAVMAAGLVAAWVLAVVVSARRTATEPEEER